MKKELRAKIHVDRVVDTARGQRKRDRQAATMTVAEYSIDVAWPNTVRRRSRLKRIPTYPRAIT